MQKALVIGGGSPNLHTPREYYFEVGNHPTSDFGKGMDWNQAEFWTILRDTLVSGNYQFHVIFIDQGSQSWFHDMEIDTFVSMFSELCQSVLHETGVILIEWYHDDFLYGIHRSLLQQFHRIGYFHASWDYMMYGKQKELQQTILQDRSGIYTKPLLRPEEKRNRIMDPSEWKEFATKVKIQLFIMLHPDIISQIRAEAIGKSLRQVVRERICM